jgi:molybdopterin-guanine dinucleotide biosynthesis protein A
MMAGLAALVLAGGSARRMGGADKPLLELGGRQILARILDALATETQTIAISANGDAARFSVFGRPVLADGDFVGQGPLAGVLAGLEWAAALGATTLLSIPGDTPFVPAGLAAALAPAPSCAASQGRVHHLAALWPVAARGALWTHLAAPGPRDVASFTASLHMRAVDFPCNSRDPFFNVNTPADLATARHIATQGSVRRTT